MKLPLPVFLKGKGNRKLKDIQAHILPSIVEWLKEHPEMGEPQAIELAPDWAYGKRQIVHFKTYKPSLFYEKDGQVQTVYQWDARKGMEKVWGQYEKLGKLTLDK
jgi:FKBP-type peptidyl-prolyl cis-trans isomerase 2